MKPFAESCAENQQVILDVLRTEFSTAQQVLEIGSGTGQHAVFFAEHLPQLRWQTSDVADYHAGIMAWIEAAQLANVLSPLTLDVAADAWPDDSFDGIFSANTVHIMSWPEVEMMFAGIGRLLSVSGRFCLYGPFNYGGEFTSPSNARFDQWLKARDSKSGVRNFEDLQRLADLAGMQLAEDYAMPANNRILVWHKVR